MLSVFSPVQQLAGMIGTLAAGALAAGYRYRHSAVVGLHVGGIDSILSAAALLILLGGCCALLVPRTPAVAAPDVAEPDAVPESR